MKSLRGVGLHSSITKSSPAESTQPLVNTTQPTRQDVAKLFDAKAEGCSTVSRLVGVPLGLEVQQGSLERFEP